MELNLTFSGNSSTPQQQKAHIGLLLLSSSSHLSYLINQLSVRVFVHVSGNNKNSMSKRKDLSQCLQLCFMSGGCGEKMY
jgi:hypothetical protein